jgi:hypothetical protein
LALNLVEKLINAENGRVLLSMADIESSKLMAKSINLIVTTFKHAVTFLVEHREEVEIE